LRFWRRFRAALRAATPLHLDVPIPVMTSSTRLEPGVFGILKPILLLPDGIHNRLTPEQLHAILAHELCHVRRRDNLAAAIHMLVESIFWFHPMVWWIGKRMVEERERACDEEVVRLGNEPGVYAEGILNVCKFYVRSPLRCASGVTGADLKKRIESIVNYRIPHKLTFARKLLLAAAGVAAVAGPVLAGILNVPQSRTRSKAERLTFEVALVNPSDPNAGGNAPAGMPGARGGGGGSLLRAQIVPAQSTKPQEPASSSTQRNPFEAVPEPPTSSLPKVSGPPIEAIEFQGARVPQFALRATITSRVGGAYDIDTLRRDSQSLYNTGRFSDVFWETEPGPKGVIVRFVLVQRPLIQSIEYQGDNTVTVPEILERFKQRKVKLRPETLYHEDELGRAAVTVQELVAERGRQNITVTPFVEPIQPSTVKITFRVEKKQ
jgi:BlaR1 peptidase M56/Surface antigen variable number repeat